MTTAVDPAIRRLQQLHREQAQIAEIRRSLDLLHEPGTVFEIRALDIPGRNGYDFKSSGYFDSFDKAAKAALEYDQKNAGGVFCTVNPVKPHLLARSANVMSDRPKCTTKDEEIDRRRWLFVDVDTSQETGIMADAEQCQAALNLSVDVADLLQAEGFPYSLLAGSGNGRYLLYRIGLPNDEETANLLKAFYESLNEAIGKYDPTKPHGEIDGSVYNASRLIRIGGSTNRKGSSVADRPHRKCEYHEPDPDYPIGILSVETIRAFVEKYKPKQTGNGKSYHATNGRTQTNGQPYSRLIVTRYCQSKGIEISAEKPINNGLAYVIRQCVFDQNHGLNNEVAICQSDGGLVTYHCKHDSCSQRTIHDVYGVLGRPTEDCYDRPPQRSVSPIAPGTRVRARDRDNFGEVVADHGSSCTVHFVSPEGSQATKELPKSQLIGIDGQLLAAGETETFHLEPISFRALLEKKYRRSFLVKNVLVDGQAGIIGGPSKSLKTSLSVDLALSLASGTPFLNEWETVQSDVLFLTGESGAERIQILARAIATAKGVCESDLPLRFDFDLPQIGNDQHLAELERVIRERILGEAPHVAIIDPIYLALQANGGQPVNMGDLTQVGTLLRRLSKLGERTGSTILINHHVGKAAWRAKKSTDEPMELEDLSQSGFAEWARQWLLVSRREPYVQGSGIHELYLNVGGSMGHSGLYAVDADEGQIDEHFDGTRWRVAVKSAIDAREERKRKQSTRRLDEKQQRREDVKAAVHKAFVSQGSHAILSASRIRDLTGQRQEMIDDLLAEMLRLGEVETIENHKFKNNREATGWRFLWKSTEPTEPTERGTLF